MSVYLLRRFPEIKRRNPDKFLTMNVDHIHKRGDIRQLRKRYENMIKRTDWHKSCSTCMEFNLSLLFVAKIFFCKKLNNKFGNKIEF